MCVRCWNQIPFPTICWRIFHRHLKLKPHVATNHILCHNSQSLAIDIVAYAAQIAAQLGAHIIKVKPPSKHIELEEAKKAYERYNIPILTLTDRVRHIIQSAFDGKRIVIFSGGPAKGKQEVLEEIRQINDGGGFGSIIGRNSFQRPEKDALDFLKEILNIYSM